MYFNVFNRYFQHSHGLETENIHKRILSENSPAPPLPPSLPTGKHPFPAPFQFLSVQATV